MALEFQNSVRRIREELAYAVQTNTHPPRDDMNRIVSALANLVTRSLEDEGHRVTREVDAFFKYCDELPGKMGEGEAKFRARVKSQLAKDNESHGEATSVVETSPSNEPIKPLTEDDKIMLALNPQPTRYAYFQRFWPLQVLLRVAAETTPASLALQLKVPEEKLKEIVAKLRERQMFSSSMQRLAFMRDACNLLMAPLAIIEPTLEGDTLIVDSKKMRLGPQQVVLLRILLHDPGKPVSFVELQRSGVKSPKMAMSRLKSRLRKNRVQLTLETVGSSYRYQPTNSLV